MHQVKFCPSPLNLPKAHVCPVDLTPAFEDANVSCLFHDMAFVKFSTARLTPMTPFGAYPAHGKDGSDIAADEMSQGTLLSLARLTTSSPSHLYTDAVSTFQQQLHPDYISHYRAHYYRSCTIIGWTWVPDALSLHEDLVEEQGASDEPNDCVIFQPEDLLFNVFTWDPGSNHQRLPHRAQLDLDITRHFELISTQTERSIALGLIADPR